jgi:NAD(P)-dependent dehydrogenase (short-subunit alcohol dehydrogenase family)
VDNEPSARVAVITAASRGIGRAISVELARGGCDVVLGVRDAAHTAELTAELQSLGSRVLVAEMDANDLESGRRAIDAAVDEFGRVDILVNNAGGGILGDAIDVTEADFEAVWALNVRSSFFLSQHAAKHMKEARGGSIVNVASQAGLVALPGEAAYCIAKAAVIHMTKCLAVEWGDFGIRVNAVAPTFIETDGTAPALSERRHGRADRRSPPHRAA